MYEAPCRLYLTRDDRIVAEGDPDAFMLFAPKGGRVPFQLARRYGLGAFAAVASASEPDAQPPASGEQPPQRRRR